MRPWFLLLPILIPVLSGILLCFVHTHKQKVLSLFSLAATLITSVFCWIVLWRGCEAPLEIVRFAPNLTLLLKLDGLGKFFLGILSVLWPLTAVYAHSYMRNEAHLRLFYGFFTATYGVTVGIALSGNLFSMYCFYEMLTLTTVPLVLQPMSGEAIRASREYFIFSLGGAAFAFTAMVFLLANGMYGAFQMGGLLMSDALDKNLVSLFWMFGFLGFGVKAAIFPLHHWLPRASVAPTPVTALLHAVAVVKAGVFAMIRLTFYCFGTDLLQGSWAQSAAICLASFTILYGSSMAVKETHVKRRLAYSTVANLSYIAFGAMLMSQQGLIASLLHMAAHACIKILSFFCIGAVLHQTGRTTVFEMDGLGKKMPVTFACFTISAFALMGLPPFSGFFSKWYLLSAGVETGGIAYVGVAALLLSAMLTAIYMLTVVRRAWYPDRSMDLVSIATVREADMGMLASMNILAVATLACGIWTDRIMQAIASLLGT